MSNNPFNKEFIRAGFPTIDLSIDGPTDSLSVCENYVWIITPNTLAAIVGAPTWTVEVSSNDVDWFEYNNESTDVAIVDAVDDNHAAFAYIRLVISSNGGSGTGIFKFQLKQ